MYVFAYEAFCYFRGSFASSSCLWFFFAPSIYYSHQYFIIAPLYCWYLINIKLDEILGPNIYSSTLTCKVSISMKFLNSFHFNKKTDMYFD